MITRRGLISGALAALAYQALPTKVYSFGAAYQTIDLAPFEPLRGETFERPVLVRMAGANDVFDCVFAGGATLVATGSMSRIFGCSFRGQFPGRKAIFEMAHG